MGPFSSWSRLKALFAFLLVVSLSPTAATPAFAAMVIPHDVQFTHGVASGDVTSTGAILWTRVDQPATVTLQIAKKPTLDVPDEGYAECQDANSKCVDATESLFRGPFLRKVMQATDAGDGTVKFEVDDLDANTDYLYRFRVGSVTSPVGSFKTAPEDTDLVPVRFAWSGDSDFNTVQGAHFFNEGEIYDAVNAEQPDFFLYEGDTIYGESFPGKGTIPPVRDFTSLPDYLGSLGPVDVTWDLPGVTSFLGDDRLENYRDHYKQNRVGPLQNLMASTSSYAIGDDHEVLSDYSGLDPSISDFVGKGYQAFEEFMPISGFDSAGAGRGFSRNIRWGKGIELFIADTRSFRSFDSDPGEACQVKIVNPLLPPANLAACLSLPAANRPAGCFIPNPKTGQPLSTNDLAPLLPKTERNALRSRFQAFITGSISPSALFPLGGVNLSLQKLYLYLLDYLLPANQPASDGAFLPVTVPAGLIPSPTPVPPVSVPFSIPLDVADANPCFSSFHAAGRTLLGQTQLAALEGALQSAEEDGVIWKVIATPDPMLQRYLGGYDSWEGFPEERTELLTFIRDNGIKNVVFLAADFHTNIMTDVRLDTIGVNASGDPTLVAREPVAKEFVAGPIAELTHLQGESMTDPVLALFQVKEFDNLGVTDFVNSNSYGYGLVDFDPETSQLKITLKNENGTQIAPDFIGGSKPQPSEGFTLTPAP